MNPVVLFIIFFLILLPIVLYGRISAYRDHQKVSKGVINYDPFMRNFVFKIKKSKEEIISTLSSQRKSDSFGCVLNKDENIITLCGYATDAKYSYDIQEFENYCILRLKQLSLSSCGDIIYRLNHFMVNNLDAEIIPYSEQGFDF